MLDRLMKQRDDIEAAMQSMIALCDSENRIFTDEEAKEFQAKKDQLGKVKAQIELQKDLTISSDPAPTVAAQKTGHVRAGGAEAKKEFSSLGEFFQAAVFNHNDPRLNYVRGEQSMGVGSAGGFAVPTIFLPEIKKMDPAKAIVRPRAAILEADDVNPDAEVTMPALQQGANSDGEHQMFGGVEVTWLAEGADKPQTQFSLRNISLKPKEVAAIIPMTDKLMRNMKTAANFSATLLKGAISAAEDYAFLRGLGIVNPAGVIPSAAAYLVNRASSNNIALADLKDLYTRFDGDETLAVWVCSKSAFRELLDITGDGGGATNVIKVDQSTGRVTIYGVPVVRVPRLPALGSKGDIGLYDFSNYLIKDGSGPIVEIGHDTGDFRANRRSIKVTWNVDGSPWLDDTYLDEGNYEVSPFSVLDVPA